MNPLDELLGIVNNFTMEEYRVPTFDGSNEVDGLDGKILSFAGLVMTTVFGGIHCIAWFFAFPTSQEQVLWRMSAVAIIFVPLICPLVSMCTTFEHTHILRLHLSSYLHYRTCLPFDTYGHHFTQSPSWRIRGSVMD
jgi:hypothetical protein